MQEDLHSLIRTLKAEKRLESFDEAATKQVVVLRVLSLLGWDIHNIDEVRPEYPVAGTKVDYLLSHADKRKVFIEVKRAGEMLDRHQEQLLNYSFKEGVQLAVLTNGITWWFYLPLYEGSWEQRKFYTIDIYDQAPDEVVSRLLEYLSKDNVVTGKAVQSAESVYRTRQKEYEISETLPKAWNKIISEPDEVLINLIAENTEKMCGYRPDTVTVKNFISSSLPESIDKIELPGKRPEQIIQTIPKSQTKEQKKGKTADDLIKRVSPEIKGLFFKLRTNILELGDNVREVVGGWYCDYRKSSTFVTVIPQSKNNRLLIYIKMGEKKIEDPQKWTSPIPSTYQYGKINTQFHISEHSQIDYAMRLIRQAYDYVP